MHNSSETAFKIFSSNLNMTCLCMDICFFSRMKFVWLLECAGLCTGLSPNLGVFNHFLFKYFSALQFFSFPSGIPRIQILDSQVLRALFTFFFHTLLFSLNNFY